MIQAKELMDDEVEGWYDLQDNSDGQIELDKERDNG
jgi:hypothetical protein